MSIHASSNADTGRIALSFTDGTELKSAKSVRGAEGIRGWEMAPKGLWYKFCKAMDWVVDLKIDGKTYVVGKNSLKNFLERNHAPDANTFTSNTAQLIFNKFVASKTGQQPQQQMSRTLASPSSSSSSTTTTTTTTTRSSSSSSASSAANSTTMVLQRNDGTAEQMAALQRDPRTQIQSNGTIVAHREAVATVLVTVPTSDRAVDGLQHAALALTQRGATPLDALATVVVGGSGGGGGGVDGGVVAVRQKPSDSAAAPRPSSPRPPAAVGGGGAGAAVVVGGGGGARPAPSAPAQAPAAASSSSAAAASNVNQLAYTQEQVNRKVTAYLRSAARGSGASTNATKGIKDVVRNFQDKDLAARMLRTAFDSVTRADPRLLDGQNANARWNNTIGLLITEASAGR